MRPGESDKVMRNAKLRGLHEWLARNIEEYDGLYEAGSVAVGDPWVDGRSDRDISLVVGGPISQEIRALIREVLGRQGFGDTYLFNLSPRRGFLETHAHHDIAMKFRGRVLFGRDLLSRKETPSREFAGGFARERIRRVIGQLQISSLNAKCWSVEHLRDELYGQLKLMFLSLADKKYAETGTYPARRADVADAYQSDDLRQLDASLIQIDQSGRDDLIRTAQLAISVLQRQRGRSA